MKFSENLLKDLMVWAVPTFAIPVLRFVQDKRDDRQMLMVRDFASYALSALAFFASLGERRIGDDPDRRLAWLLALWLNRYVHVVPAWLAGKYVRERERALGIGAKSLLSAAHTASVRRTRISAVCASTPTSWCWPWGWGPRPGSWPGPGSRPAFSASRSPRRATCSSLRLSPCMMPLKVRTRSDASSIVIPSR